MNKEFGNLILKYLREILAELDSAHEKKAEIEVRLARIDQMLKPGRS